jgi:hypothetical protein
MSSDCCLDNWEGEGYIYLVVPKLARCPQLLGDSGCRADFPVQNYLP